MIRRNQLISALLLLMSLGGHSVFAQASDTWGLVKKYIAVHPRMDEEVWENPENSLVTNGALEMTPRGDGTYEAVIPLNIGSTYNYIFFAKTEGTPPEGLQPWTTYFDAVPTSGSIQSGTQPNMVSPSDTWYNPVTYTEVVKDDGSKHARRMISVPSILSPGDSLYVYNNFADKPITPQNLEATPVDTKTIRLTWDPPYTAWGSWGESVKAADVLAGGYYSVFRSLTGDTGTYVLVDTVPGEVLQYWDTDVSLGNTYYYIIAARDAYQGLAGQPFEQLASDTSSPETAAIVNPIPVTFKVEHFNYDFVRKNDYLVYLTPDFALGPFSSRRQPGLVTRIDFVKTAIK